MKLFAITPANFSCEDVLNHLPSVQSKGTSFIYLRSPLVIDCLELLIPAINAYDIMPLIPFRLIKNSKGLPCGIHFKSSETGKLSEKIYPSQTMITASCHDFTTAVKLFESSINYVFVSPVFKPYTKQSYTRNLFPRNQLKKLIMSFGERVVVLGGMNCERLNILKEDVLHDFSVAGINMFFGKQA